MTVTISTPRYLRSQLRSFTATAIFIVLVYAIAYFVFDHAIRNFEWIAAMFIILQLANVAKVFRVASMKIDRDKNEFQVGLKSILSGEQKRTYSLSQIETLVTRQRRFLRPDNPRPYLIIKAGNEETYQITDSMGMRFEEMNMIDEAVKQTEPENKDYLTSF